MKILKNRLAGNLPEAGIPPVDFTKKSFPSSSFHDFDAATGTSALHSELQRGPLSLETLGKLLGTAPPPPPRPIREIIRLVKNGLFSCECETPKTPKEYEQDDETVFKKL
jgi:hypothetical protein